MAEESSKIETSTKRRVPPNAGKGRPAGTPNKATANAREAIARFVDANAPRLQEWLEQIAADPKHGPMAAFRCVQDVLEYHIPKLQRTDIDATLKGSFVVRLDSGDADA